MRAIAQRASMAWSLHRINAAARLTQNAFAGREVNTVPGGLLLQQALERDSSEVHQYTFRSIVFFFMCWLCAVCPPFLCARARSLKVRRFAHKHSHYLGPPTV